MKLKEFDVFGKQTPSFDQVQAKHGLTYTELIVQLARGIKSEMEHTNDMSVAREIALDHLNELPDYYTRLAKMEK